MSDVLVVRDHEISRKATETVLAMSDPRSGCVVIHPAPARDDRLWGLAVALADALGKDRKAPVFGREARELWRQHEAWMAGMRPQRVILCGAEHVRVDKWDILASLCADVGAQLVLHLRSDDPLKRGQREHLRDRDWPQVDVTDWLTDAPEPLAAHLPGAPTSDESAPALFPTVPSTEFLFFLADCRRIFAPADFNRVATEVAYGRQAAEDFIQQGRLKEARRDMCVQQMLRSLLTDCADVNRALCRLRGAQSALLPQRMAIKVQPHNLTSALGSHASLDDENCRRLERCPSVRHAAASMLCLLSRASPATLAQIDVADARPGAVRIDGQWLVIPGCARIIWDALLADRRLLEAESDDPLLAEGRRGRVGARPSPHAVRLAIRAVSRATGVSAWGENFTTEKDGPASWLARRGVKVAQI